MEMEESSAAFRGVTSGIRVVAAGAVWFEKGNRIGTGVLRNRSQRVGGCMSLEIKLMREREEAGGFAGGLPAAVCFEPCFHFGKAGIWM